MCGNKLCFIFGAIEQPDATHLLTSRYIAAIYLIRKPATGALQAVHQLHGCAVG